VHGGVLPVPQTVKNLRLLSNIVFALGSIVQIRNMTEELCDEADHQLVKEILESPGQYGSMVIQYRKACSDNFWTFLSVH